MAWWTKSVKMEDSQSSLLFSIVTDSLSQGRHFQFRELFKLNSKSLIVPLRHPLPHAEENVTYLSDIYVMIYSYLVRRPLWLRLNQFISKAACTLSLSQTQFDGNDDSCVSAWRVIISEMSTWFDVHFGMSQISKAISNRVLCLSLTYLMSGLSKW